MCCHTVMKYQLHLIALIDMKGNFLLKIRYLFIGTKHFIFKQTLDNGQRYFFLIHLQFGIVHFPENQIKTYCKQNYRQFNSVSIFSSFGQRKKNNNVPFKLSNKEKVKLKLKATLNFIENVTVYRKNAINQLKRKTLE